MLTTTDGVTINGRFVAEYSPIQTTETGVDMGVVMSNGATHVVHVPTPEAAQRNAEMIAQQAAARAQEAATRAGEIAAQTRVAALAPSNLTGAVSEPAMIMGEI